MTQTLLQAGLLNAVLASLLAVVVVGLACLFRARPALVHGLWLLVMLKLVTPPLIQLPLPWPPQDNERTAVVSAEEPAELERPCISLVLPEPAGIEVSRPDEQKVSMEPVAEVSSPIMKTSDWLPELILGLWLSGTLTFWCMAAFRLVRLYHILRILPPNGVEIQERIDALAAELGLRQRPRGFLVPGVIPPMLLALWGVPRLLLPSALWARLDEMQRDTLLLHELAHLCRGDHRVRWLELTVKGTLLVESDGVVGMPGAAGRGGRVL